MGERRLDRSPQAGEKGCVCEGTGFKQEYETVHLMKDWKLEYMGANAGKHMWLLSKSTQEMQLYIKIVKISKLPRLHFSNIRCEYSTPVKRFWTQYLCYRASHLSVFWQGLGVFYLPLNGHYLK